MTKTIYLLLISIFFGISVKGQGSTGRESKNPQPNNWSYLSAGFDWGDDHNIPDNQCGSKQMQSPIDIPERDETYDTMLKIFWNDTTIHTKMKYTGGAFQSPGLWSHLHVIDVDGNELIYHAIQFHIHFPGENLLDGRRHDAQLHIVHWIDPAYENQTQFQAAVLGIMFEDEKYNNTFFQKWSPPKVFNGTNLDKEFDVSLNMKELIGNAIGEDYTYYTFHGSLTSPPCSEIINWYVLQEPLPIGFKQQAAFNQFYQNNFGFAQGRGNSRFYQPVGDRLVKQSNLRRNQINPKVDFQV